MAQIQLKITNFSQFIKRKDRKSIPWVAIKPDFLTQPDVFELTSEELKLFFHVIFTGANNKSEVVAISTAQTAQFLNIQETSVVSAIQKLSKSDRISLMQDVDFDVLSKEVVTTGNQMVTTKKKQSVKRKPSPKIPFNDVYFDQFVKDKWQQLYPFDYITEQEKKVDLWLRANPNKDSKTTEGWVQFYSNWLSRGYPEWKVVNRKPINIFGRNNNL